MGVRTILAQPVRPCMRSACLLHGSADQGQAEYPRPLRGTVGGKVVFYNRACLSDMTPHRVLSRPVCRRPPTALSSPVSSTKVHGKRARAQGLLQNGTRARQGETSFGASAG